MFRYIKLKNYKSLVNLEADFTGKRGTPKKMILIYGENGVGKSNLASAFYTLCETLTTRSAKEILQKLSSEKEWKKILSLEEAMKKDRLPSFAEIVKENFKDMEFIIKDCKTLNSEENMVLEFGFRVKDKNGVYHLETDNTKIVSEKLEYVWNKNQTVFFDISEENRKLNENIFKDNNYYKEFSDLIEKYWGKHSVLSLLNYEIEDKAEGYVKKRISKNLFDILTFFSSLSIRFKKGSSMQKNRVGVSHKILSHLDKGTISLSEEKTLEQVEALLNEFFTCLYSDIKQVYYKKEVMENKLKYQLYLKKLVYNNIIDISFDLESTGTQYLLELIPFFLAGVEGQIVIIDELDTGIHDLMINTILENLNHSIQGQIIITTHNTMLLESDLAKENVYIFNVDQNADKELVPLTEFEKRIHPNLNIRKRYLKGLYGGIPMTMDIDFDDLVDMIKTK